MKDNNKKGILFSIDEKGEITSHSVGEPTNAEILGILKYAENLSLTSALGGVVKEVRLGNTGNLRILEVLKLIAKAFVTQNEVFSTEPIQEESNEEGSI